MSDPEFLPPARDPGQLGKPSHGPSLTLIYGLIALALAAAVGLAMLIVLPFYRRR